MSNLVDNFLDSPFFLEKRLPFLFYTSENSFIGNEFLSYFLIKIVNFKLLQYLSYQMVFFQILIFTLLCDKSKIDRIIKHCKAQILKKINEE